MTALDERDLLESFSRSSGPGGQHLQKNSTRVRLRHRPTGLEVVVQDSRSREQNRATARRLLALKIQQARDRARREKVSAREAARRRNRPRPASLKRRFVELKRRRSATKTRRSGSPSDD